MMRFSAFERAVTNSKSSESMTTHATEAASFPSALAYEGLCPVARIVRLPAIFG